MSEVRATKTKHTKSLLITGVISFVVGVLLLFVARYLASNYNIFPNSSSIYWWYKLSQNTGIIFFWVGLILVVVYASSIITEKFKKQ